MNWEIVKENLKTMGVSYQEQPCEETLHNFIKQCGYETHPMIVDLTNLSTVDADLGVVVSHENPETNDGVYVFCVLKNHTLGLITVIPSTISKGPMIRQVA